MDHVAAVELRNLEQIAQSTAGRIGQLIGDSRNLAKYVGTDDDFVAYLARPTKAGTSAILAKLEGLVAADPDVQFAMVMDAGGNAIVASDPEVMGKNFRFREYFRQAMEGHAHMTGMTVGAVAGEIRRLLFAPGVRARRPHRDRGGGAARSAPSPSGASSTPRAWARSASRSWSTATASSSGTRTSGSCTAASCRCARKWRTRSSPTSASAARASSRRTSRAWPPRWWARRSAGT